MTSLDRMHDRLRWRCRRGMLELDLGLNAFLDRHLDELEPSGIEAFKSLLALPDPDLLDHVMGRTEPESSETRDVLALMRKNRAISTVPSL
jgi:antitoxin CptB